MYEELLLPSGWQEWKITEQIGRGSFGTVYKAERRLSDSTASDSDAVKTSTSEDGTQIDAEMEFCAVKVIDVPQDEEDLKLIRMECDSEDSVKAYLYDVTQNYMKEIQMMNALREVANIVRIEDFFVEEKEEIGWRIYIRMEYLQDFRYYCPSHTMSVNEVCALAIDICTALAYCEQQKILHRDIKSGNILRSPEGVYKLGDFGMARVDNSASVSYSAKGTFSYMAPEVYFGRHYNNTADIYSLGIVMYRLTNRNRLPFENIYKQMLTYHDKEEALNRRIQGEAIPAPIDAGNVLSEIIQKACAYEPEQRYQTAEEMKDDLLRMQRRLPTSTGAMVVQSQNEETEAKFSKRDGKISKSGRNRFHLFKRQNNYIQEQNEKMRKAASRRTKVIGIIAIAMVVLIAAVAGNIYRSAHQSEAGVPVESDYDIDIYEATSLFGEISMERVMSVGVWEALDLDFSGEMCMEGGELWAQINMGQEKTRWIMFSEMVEKWALLLPYTEHYYYYEDCPELINSLINGYVSDTFGAEASSLAVFSAADSLKAGETETPGAAAWPDIECYSSDESVVTVSSEGEVTAVGEGSACVVIITSDGMCALYVYTV
ncbi:MAG: protein kinase [Lachnospiraceae bacterium]|nr:protein kinase [Lachnospiraceae bacterium]